MEILGLDEITLKKGYRDYVALVTGRMKGGELDIGSPDGHEKEKILNYLLMNPLRIAQKVKAVCLRPVGNLNRGNTRSTHEC